MDEAEKYLFEVHGYLVIEDALSPEEVAAANAAIDHHADQIGIRANDLAHESETLMGTYTPPDFYAELTEVQQTVITPPKYRGEDKGSRLYKSR